METSLGAGSEIPRMAVESIVDCKPNEERPLFSKKEGGEEDPKSRLSVLSLDLIALETDKAETDVIALETDSADTEAALSIELLGDTLGILIPGLFSSSLVLDVLKGVFLLGVFLLAVPDEGCAVFLDAVVIFFVCSDGNLVIESDELVSIVL